VDLVQRVENKVKPLDGKTKSEEDDFIICKYSSAENWNHAQRKSEHRVTSILRPVHRVLADPWKFGNDLTKRDHFIMVEGPGNSLD